MTLADYKAAWQLLMASGLCVVAMLRFCQGRYGEALGYYALSCLVTRP